MDPTPPAPVPTPTPHPHAHASQSGRVDSDQISWHEATLFAALRRHPQWLSHADLARLCPGLAPRTIRAHVLAFARAGLVDREALFPGFHVRWREATPAPASAAGQALGVDGAYLRRLERAAALLGERPR